MLACEVWDVAPSCWKYPTESSTSCNWFRKVLKISIYAAVLMVSSKKMGPIMRCRDIPHLTPIFSEWRGSSCIAFGFSLAQISHTTNVLLFKFLCNIFIGVRIIKEMPGSVPSGTHCIMFNERTRVRVSNYQHNAQFLYSITIDMLHYNPRHVSSSTLLTFRRSNCIITESGIVILCKRPYSMPVESGLTRVPLFVCLFGKIFEYL